MDQVIGEVQDGLAFGEARQVCLQDLWQEFLRGLDRAFGPPVLLAFDARHLHGQLRRTDDVRHKLHTPTPQLGAITQIEVFGQGICLPATSVINRLPAPDPSRTIKIQEQAGPAARCLLDPKVAVNPEGLRQGETGVSPVEVPPACLHHGNSGVLEERQGTQEKVRRRDKIGVEDGDKLARCARQALGQCPGLVSVTVGPTLQRDVETQVAIALNEQHGRSRRLVCGVIENLDLQLGAWVAQAQHHLNQPLDDVTLVVNRQLHGHTRELWCARLPGLLHCRLVLEHLFPGTAVQEEHDIAIHTIEEETASCQAMQ